jgi:glycosyltransferase involved in cell wall biosynthesis
VSAEQPPSLVFVTQTIDADDPHLAQTIDLVAALARRCERVAVICDRVRRHDLPRNVSFRTFGAAGRARRTLRYLRAVSAELRSRPDALVSHMVPIFLVLAAPPAKLRRVPLVLWYTHWNADWTLRLATRLADAAVSVDRRSYPLDSPKVRGIGHAVDLAAFEPRAGAPAAEGALRLLALGRTQPQKGFVTLLRGFERALDRGLDARLELRGPQINEPERRHRAELEQLIASSEVLRGRASIEEPVPRREVAGLIRAADAVVNPTLTPTGGGSLDKVVFEASACAVPVIASNPNLDGLLDGLGLELRFRPGDPDDLARVLLAFAETDAAARGAAGLELRRRTESGHSVDSWADGVVRTVRELQR